MTAILFITAVTVLWMLVLWNTFVALAGFSFHQQRLRMSDELHERASDDSSLPGVSVLIPAHNEGRVMERSLANLLAMDYPKRLLEILVIDDASADETGAICDRFARSDKRVRVIHVPPGAGGRGKSAALNRALAICKHPYIAVYDADNRPRADALRRLAAEITTDPRCVATVGRIVKMNRRNTLLNRFCSLEFSGFQWAVQAGRARLFDLVMITGTNFLVHADTVRALGGWDIDALTEDLELSVRLYAAGHRVRFVPEAVSDEQDPERLRPWLRQRVRWMSGNYYVIGRHLGTAMRARDPRIAIEIFSLSFVYVFFLAFLVLSDAIAIGGILGLIHFTLDGPYVALWFVAFGVFLVTIQLTQALEGEDRWSTPFVAALMYFTYTQLWLFVAARSLARAVFTRRKQLVWVPTPRSHA